MEQMKIEIKAVLKKAGITPDLKGYHYLAEAISIKMNGNSDSKQMENYSEIAEKNNDTVTRTERAMRYAVAKVEEYKTPFFQEHFDIGRKLSVSDFVSLVVEYLEIEKTEK